VSIGPLALGLIAAAGALVALSLYACGRIVASVAADELKGWLPHIAAGIIATAVARLPETERARYDEEWLGELLAYQDRPVTALIFAIGVRRRVSEVANELPSPSAEPERLAEYALPDEQAWTWDEERWTWNAEPWTWNAERWAKNADNADSIDRRTHRAPLTHSEFASFLRKVRGDAWLTDEWLSEELNYPEKQIAAWMAGKETPPTRDVVKRLEQLFSLRDGLLVEPWEQLRETESRTASMRRQGRSAVQAWLEVYRAEGGGDEGSHVR
jgi:ribosome-binding protein aMBF1 (putative translation factor)